jgi:hypothetical protein
LNHICDHLNESSDCLSGTQYHDLFQVWVKTVQYKEMLRILDTLNDVKSVPERIEDALNAKMFTNAINLILSTANILKNPDFSQISALREVQRIVEYRKGVHAFGIPCFSLNN